MLRQTFAEKDGGREVDEHALEDAERIDGKATDLGDCIKIACRANNVADAADENPVGLGTSTGAETRLPPRRHTVHRGLQIPDLGARDDSPLRASFHHVLPATCSSPRLSTQRIRPCGLNAMCPSRSQPCADSLRN